MTDSGTEKSHTASPAVLGGLLYLAASLAETKTGSPSGGHDRAANRLDAEILSAVGDALQAQFPEDPRTVRTTLDEVASAVEFVRAQDQAPSLTAAKYDAQRTTELKRLGVASIKGASVWPPTSQTAVQRFGSWNEALKAAGLATSAVGRAKGQLRFDAAAYDRAITEFVADCESRGLGTTYKVYGEYASEHKGEVPSAAAVRKFYGSWSSALAAVG